MAEAIRLDVKRICNLPREQRASGKSMLLQMRECGLLAVGDTGLTREAIREVIDAEPTLIEVWLEYSADKRSGGWYFEPTGCVGYFGPDKPDLPPRFDGLIDACTEFIWRELTTLVKAIHERLSAPPRSAEPGTLREAIKTEMLRRMRARRGGADPSAGAGDD